MQKADEAIGELEQAIEGMGSSVDSDCSSSKQIAYEKHSQALEGALILVNCVMCPCGQPTTTNQTDECLRLAEEKSKSKQVRDGVYQCGCGTIIDTNKDSFEEATVGSLNGLPHIQCPSCKECLGCM